MKKILVAAATAVVVIIMAGSAFAASSNASVFINATVGSSCTAIAANALTILVDPTAGTNQNSTGGNTTVQCTNTTPVTVTAASTNSGASSGVSPIVGTLKSGINSIPYNFYFAPALTGLGTGGASYDLTIVTGTGSAGLGTGAVVLAANAATAAAGAYTDQVTVTISY